MAETYNVRLFIGVVKKSTGEDITSEEFYFNDQSFSKMANLADEFYTLIEKLQKIK